MPDVEIVDYQGANPRSLQNCLERLDVTYRLVTGVTPPSGNRPLILPGTGTFGNVCRALSEDGLDQRVRSIILSGTPFLGISAGLQILMEGSEESLEVSGLGLISGRVVRFQADKVPQVGWNKVASRRQGWSEGFAYFVNSYHAQLRHAADLWYTSNYSGTFCAALRRDNISGFQFHPEKSGPFGQELLGQWCREATI